MKIHRTHLIVDQQPKRQEKYWQDGLHIGNENMEELGGKCPYFIFGNCGQSLDFTCLTERS